MVLRNGLLLIVCVLLSGAQSPAADFPLGIWYEGGVGALRNDLIPSDPKEAAKTYQRDFADIAAHGLNTVVVPNTPPEHHKALLDAAEANHLRLIIELGVEGGDLGAMVRGKAAITPDAIKETLHAMLDPIKDHPALYRVQLIDEPNPGNFDRYAKVAEGLKAYEPKIKPFSCLVGTAYALDFLKSTHSDAVVFDAYPIMVSTPLGDVSPMQLFANVAGGGNTAAQQAGAKAWAVVQTHAITNVHRFPSPVEIRCMTYGALASGCKGVFWFLYQTEFWNKARNEKMSGLVDENFKGDDRWAEVGKLAGEIKALAPTLADMKVNGEQPTSPTKALIKAMTGGNGRNYFFVVNLDTLHRQKIAMHAPSSDAESVVLLMPEGTEVERTHKEDQVLWDADLAPGSGALYKID